MGQILCRLVRLRLLEQSELYRTVDRASRRLFLHRSWRTRHRLRLGIVVIFPHPLFHPSKIHGVSLIISPVLTGFGMSAFGALLRRRGKKVVQIESFPYAFAFAFGMAVVRLVYVS